MTNDILAFLFALAGIGLAVVGFLFIPYVPVSGLITDMLYLNAIISGIHIPYWLILTASVCLLFCAAYLESLP